MFTYTKPKRNKSKDAISYLRVSYDVFVSKTKSGKWNILQAPSYWNGFAAWTTIRDKNNKEYKLIIVNYYIKHVR